jgi:energy-coupling factor transporter ATP-binding protein EcfA2
VFDKANPFSLGQEQKHMLSVANIIAIDQPLLILDEPSFGLYRRTTQPILEIKSLSKKLAEYLKVLGRGFAVHC